MVLDRSVFRWYRDDRRVCVDFDTDPTHSGMSSWRGDVDRSVSWICVIDRYVLCLHCWDGTPAYRCDLYDVPNPSSTANGARPVYGYNMSI